MNGKKLNLTRTISGLIAYSSIILFISSYFDLDLPLETLLEKLKSKLLMSFLFGAALIFFQNWALKKGGISTKEND